MLTTLLFGLQSPDSALVTDVYAAALRAFFKPAQREH
jgi:hypothetical protein